MRIDQSNIFMNSSRTYLEKDEVKESLQVWVGQQQPASVSQTDQISISSKAASLLDEFNGEIKEAELSENMDGEISLKKLIAEILSGRKIKFVRIDKVNGETPEVTEKTEENSSQAGESQGWGLRYDSEKTHLEKEDVAFEAKGIIRTADGKNVVFTLRLDMNREYLEKNSISIRAGDAAVDPLIINYGGKAAELSDRKFSFDLNADGNEDTISVPLAGSGFLALDQNNNEVIDNGSELFGPSTGNGFAELAGYDSDGNKWIDENDEAYQRLRVMTVNEQGDATLGTLKEMGIGAIYLDKSSTQFDVRTDDNSLLGQVRTTGIYLQEDGTPGTIQQLDLVA